MVGTDLPRSRHPRLALALVMAEGFLGRLTFGIVSFALPLYALSRGVSLGEVGLIISLRTLVALALKPAAGRLSDLLGVRTVYMAGTAARVAAAAVLLAADSLAGLAAVRVLQGASAAGRDVASLGVIARDAQARIGSAYSWYASAKHVGGVSGAAVAGFVIAGTGGSFHLLFVLVLLLSALPVAAAWLALRDAPAGAFEIRTPEAAAPSSDQSPPAPRAGAAALLRELSGPASVGMLVATSAYMVHGMFPVIATEHAGLSAAQTGAIFSLSAVVFLVSGPAFGWLIDRYGHAGALAWRSGANIGSSILYMASPTFIGLGVARSLDDSGKAAFRPAWAALIARVAAADPPRRGQRLGLLDTAQTVGEAMGPALAAVLWQWGGIAALFGVRIAIAAAAELTALALARHSTRGAALHRQGEEAPATPGSLRRAGRSVTLRGDAPRFPTVVVRPRVTRPRPDHIGGSSG
jgi:MFS family permease